MTHQGFTCNVVGGILMMRSLIPSINVHISVLNCPHSRPHLSENQHQVREESHNQNDFSIYFEFSHYYPPPLPALIEIEGIGGLHYKLSAKENSQMVT